MGRIKIDDIAEELAESAGISKRLSKLYAKALFSSIVDHLADGDEVMIGSFGKFETAVYAARAGRNIQTGEKLTVPAKHRIKFEMSRSLLKAFNSGAAGTEAYDDSEQ